MTIGSSDTGSRIGSPFCFPSRYAQKQRSSIAGSLTTTVAHLGANWSYLFFVAVMSSYIPLVHTATPSSASFRLWSRPTSISRSFIFTARPSLALNHICHASRLTASTFSSVARISNFVESIHIPLYSTVVFASNTHFELKFHPSDPNTSLAIVVTSAMCLGSAAHRLSSMQFVPRILSARMNVSTTLMILVKTKGATDSPNGRIVGLIHTPLCLHAHIPWLSLCRGTW